MISNGIKRLLSASAHLLNQPPVKEGIKNIASSITFTFGIIEAYDIYQIACGREISSEVCSKQPKWIQTTKKVVIICAKVSLILSGGVSRPGVFVISNLVGCIFSTTQLNRVFGPNTIFAINPWHPRHIISIIAIILALPSVIQSTYDGSIWIYRKICDRSAILNDDQKANNWLTDSKIRLMTLFNTATSRVTLHKGNELVRFILRARV